MANVSLRIKELRTEFHLSQQMLADRLGVSKSSINMYERGEREPKLETLEVIADFFNVDMGYLVGVSDVRNSSLVHPSFSAHEICVINAYRKHPELQAAIDRMLEVDRCANGNCLSDVLSDAAETIAETQNMFSRQKQK